MIRPRAWTGLALALALTSCELTTVGPRVADFPPAQSGRGTTADVTIGVEAELRGELIEATDSAIVLLTSDDPARLVSIDYRAIRRARFHGARVEVGHRRVPAADVLERLRRMSRHSAGLSVTQRRALLDAYGQTELVEVEP